MHISELEMFEILRTRMSESEAKNFLTYIESKVEDKFLDAKDIFSTKEDLLKLELKIVQTISDSNQRIEQSKTELLKWLITLILGSTIAIIGTILAVMRMSGWGN
jgi:hypothetical protein